MSYRGLSQHVNFEKLQDPGDRFLLQELIGEGTYGVVYSARDSETGQSKINNKLVTTYKYIINISANILLKPQDKTTKLKLFFKKIVILNIQRIITSLSRF